MIKHLNNKGYLLVEIILASVIAMVMAYFMTDLTIKLKNKNDDLLVRTLASTDQAIIYNAIMKDLYKDNTNFSCDDIEINGNKFSYKGFVNIMNQYINLNEFKLNCDITSETTNSYAVINIPIKVKQLPDENFDVDIKFKIEY